MDQDGESNFGLDRWMRELATTIKPLIPADYCGAITFNVYKGGISNIETKITTQTKRRERR